jgi:GPH family glycoside/pentoside/hexuronide:cation symporter
MSGAVSNTIRAAYGIGDYAICLYWGGVSTFLLYFYTDVVEISTSAAGIIMLISMTWDAVTDPFMGFLAERTRSKMGSYRPYIYYGSIPLALSFILLLWVPPYEGYTLLIFLLLVNLFHRTCFTIVSVPYSSLTARITDSSDERTILTSSRMLFAALGTFSVGTLGFPIIFYFGGGDESVGFVYLGAISGLLAIIILQITVYFVQERSFKTNKNGLPNFIEVTKSVSSNFPFWIVFSAIIILISTYLMFSNNLIYYTKYALGLHEYQFLIQLVLLGTTLITVPLWAYAALKLGKKNTWLISMVILFFGFSTFYYYPINNLNTLLYILVLIGFGNGATGVLFWSMLPDTIEYGEWKSGIRTESSLYGFMTFAQKGSIAISLFILTIILTNIGFEPNQEQSSETIKALKSLMSIIPLIGVCISFALLYFYPIDKNFHEKLIQDIENRRALDV